MIEDSRNAVGHDEAGALRAAIAARLAGFERCETVPHALKAAAVAIAVTVEAAGPAFLLTRRSGGLRAHAGQWALPGGRIDPGETPVEAALRELDEELGLRLGGADVLAVLDDYPTRSGYAITPVVAWAGAAPQLRPNPAEVASVHRIGFDELDRPGSPEFETLAESDRPVVRLLIGDTRVHAPTAALLYQFREVALRGRTVRVAHLEQPVWAWR
ncbi:MAG: NUDIX hydrolase [Alphaproteobacteria bacterium]